MDRITDALNAIRRIIDEPCNGTDKHLALKLLYIRLTLQKIYPPTKEEKEKMEQMATTSIERILRRLERS